MDEIFIPRIMHISPRITHKVEHSIYIMPSERLGLDAELENFGWKKVGRSYIGKIQGRTRSYNAILQPKGNGGYDLLIQAPSPNVFNGTHKSCFTYFRDDFYHVHFKNGKDPISKISKLQQYIRQVGG